MNQWFIKVLFQKRPKVTALGKWSAFILPVSLNIHFCNFLTHFHIYRLMTHFIPVQSTRFFCMAHSLLEMLLGRASMKELSVLVLFLFS